MTLDLAALEALSAAATPVLWTYCVVNKGQATEHYEVVGEPVRRNGASMTPVVCEATFGPDAEFVVAARTAVPELVARVRKAEADVQEAWARRRLYFHERAEGLLALAEAAEARVRELDGICQRLQAEANARGEDNERRETRDFLTRYVDGLHFAGRLGDERAVREAIAALERRTNDEGG